MDWSYTAAVGDDGDVVMDVSYDPVAWLNFYGMFNLFMDV
jgi:hypothetical protein